MVKKTLEIILLLFLFGVTANAQTNRQIKSKNKELSRIRSEISQLEKDVQSLSSKEKSAGAELENIQKQIFLVEKLIRKTDKKINRTKREIKKLTNSIAGLEKDKKSINAALNQYAVWLYESRDAGLLDFLLDSKSFNEAYNKVYYFKFFNRSVEEKTKKLNDIEAKLKQNKRNLYSEEKSLRKLIASNLETAGKLKRKLAEQKILLAEIRKNKKRKTALVSKKKRSEKQIASLIDNLIKRAKALEEAKRKEEIASREKEEKNAAVTEKNLTYYPNVKFSKLKGNLPWPISRGRIVKKFGKIRNRKLKTVIVNSGIDIKAGKAQTVHAVAGGVVSTISWLPGFGSVVIVTHNKNYRTVYGHLGSIKVEEGEKVKAGEALGNVAEGVEGNILHFEIWNGREYKNPQNWLTRK